MAKFLPWSVETVQGGPKIYAGGGSDHAICQLFSRDGVAFLDANENAAFIVKAVNNHDALVEALTDLIEAVRRDSDEGGKGISGYTAARLTDARAILAAVVGSAQASGGGK